MSTSAAKRPSVRKIQTDQTRTAILEAAQRLFSSRGYSETGVRDIAAEAGVNPALISRYFGSKLQLFETALENTLGVSVFTDGDRDQFGRRVTDMICLSERDQAGVIPALVLSAGDSAAREIILRQLKLLVLEPLEQWFNSSDASERAAQLTLIVTGFFTYRDLLPLDALKGDASEAMRVWLARTLQEIVDR